MCVRQPAAGPSQAIIPKFGVGSSFYRGSVPSQGATLNAGPRPHPGHAPGPAPGPAHGPAHFYSLVP
jgi:hypothetical protein